MSETTRDRPRSTMHYSGVMRRKPLMMSGSKLSLIFSMISGEEAQGYRRTQHTVQKRVAMRPRSGRMLWKNSNVTTYIQLQYVL